MAVLLYCSSSRDILPKRTFSSFGSSTPTLLIVNLPHMEAGHTKGKLSEEFVFIHLATIAFTAMPHHPTHSVSAKSSAFK
ncbi:hypothetical protein TcWFU_001730 [Taenia crassiceps]|uniref:Uncharacterized protein n=1 Tax=Taenia crassiceps TaxID=6207 RepID=A0ABR4Q3A0_9CEST